MDRSEKAWDRLAKKFDRTARNFEEEHKIVIEKTRKYLNAEDVVMDFGCATGATAIEIAGYAKHVYGIDISSNMIETANSKLEKSGIRNIEFLKATIFHEELKNKEYDVITAFNILHLLEDAENAIKQINALLKPGGLFLSSTVCMKETPFLSHGILHLVSKIIGITHIQFFKSSDLEGFLQNAGFQIIEKNRLKNKSYQYFIAAKKQ